MKNASPPILLITMLTTTLLFTLILAACANQGKGAPDGAADTQAGAQAGTQQAATDTRAAIDACIQACKTAQGAGINLSAGPCLLDPLPENSLWVCDVAHEPREAADNLPANQCASYINGSANRFIEVTPECIFIRTG